MSAEPARGVRSAARLPGTLVDRVSDQCPGALEIGFSISRQYNASSILFDNLERGYGARTAIDGPGGRFTYAALCAQANRAANALRSLGLKRGERILLLLDDTPMFPIFFFGAVRAGFVPVPLNTLAPPELLRFHLLDANARIVVADADLLDRLTVETVRDTPLETTIVCNGERMAAHLRARPAASWLAGFSELGAAADTGRDEMALWMYSSGSTGRPKGIVHLQHDLAYVVASYARHVLKLEPEDLCYSPPKMFFSYGFGNSLLFPFSAGASSVLCPVRPTPDRVFAALARYRPSVFFGLPTLYTALAKAPEVETADFSSLRLCVSAAETLSREISLAWTACSGLPVVECLGSTEMLNVYLSNDADDRRSGSAGRRVPGYELKLCDAGGHEVPDGEEGVLWVRGQSSAPLYWNRPEQTAKTMRGDWICTGDRFVRDGDEFYYFRGRADDLFKVSGQWVYPLEVELCLAGHEMVREVAVVGHRLPDARMALKAYVVTVDPKLEPDAVKRELRKFVKQKLLPHKSPRLIEFMPELPKTGTGKIDRQALKARAGEPMQ